MAYAEENQTCPTNQFNAFGHCYAIGTPSIPNPTSGCGHNGRMCPSIPCPSGYAMTPIYINGLLTDFQCANLSNCPSGTVSHNNACVATETGQQESSPFKQIKSGIQVQDVKCNLGYSLVIRPSNDHPYCVKSSHVASFLVRDWITLSKFQSMHQVTAHNQINNTITQSTTHISNGIRYSNTTVTDNNTSNGTNANSNTINLVTQNGTIPIPAIITTTKPNTIKIISVGISSNPLRVGDEPEFILTFQNISHKTIYENTGCNITPVSLTISPADNAYGPLYESIKSGCKELYHSPIYPNQTVMAQASPDLQKYEIYLLSTPGKLDVYMVLFLEDNKLNPINSVVRFSTKVVGGPIFENCSGLPSYGGGNCGGSGVMYSGTVNASNLPPLPHHPHPAPKLSLPSYPPILVEPVSNSDFVKILLVGMWPNQLKVGDKPTFSVTYQNISNDTIYIGEGCQASSVYYEIYPPSSVSTERPLYLCAGSSRTVAVDPNKVITDITTISYEQKPVTVIKSGVITVKITIRFSTSLYGGGSSDTVQFNVNATQ